MKRVYRVPVLGLLAVLVLCGPALAQKPTLAVTEFTNETAAAWWRGGVGWELSGMLSNELAATGAFRVLERSQLQAVLEEQNLGMSGRVRPDTAARIGQLVGAQYLVTGTVTAYETRSSGTGAGISFRGVSIGGKSEQAYIAVDLRVIDTTTGEIAYVRTVEGTSSSSGMRLGLYQGGFGGTLATENNTPAGQAIRAALIEATDYLECAMVKQDSCMRQYQAREDRRRERTRSTLRLN